MYVSLNIYIYIYIYIYMYVCKYIYKYIDIHMNICVYIGHYNARGGGTDVCTNILQTSPRNRQHTCFDLCKIQL